MKRERVKRIVGRVMFGVGIGLLGGSIVSFDITNPGLFIAGFVVGIGFLTIGAFSVD